MSTSVYDIPVNRIDGAPASLGDYRGKVLLVVNVASKCGLTPQYEGLEKLHAAYRDRGLVVCGFPANDFGAQEPGTNAEIQQFCTSNYGVDFPMFAKIVVTGAAKHALYGTLTSAVPAQTVKEGTDFRGMLKGYGIEPNPAPEVLWNFEKFLVGRDGKVLARFNPDIAPDDPLLTGAIEQALAS